jgi:predicted dehydrogenase
MRLRWGLIGGGEGSQIGGTHRIAAARDGAYDFVAGAVDIDPARGREYAQRLGVPADRAYGDWREMLAGETKRPDRIDLVTVATPNASHYEITKAFLEAGIDVLCEKPLTTTVAEAEDIVRTARERGLVCGVNYGYSGYPLVRHARAMVKRGDLGRIRVVVAEFAYGHHADAADADNPRVRWRYDPKLAGVSSVVADAGIHALHMACFVTGQEIETVSADFASTVPGRELEDDAFVAFRMSDGAVGRLWASAVALGRMHGLTIQVYGEKAGLRWAQERPNQLYVTRLREPTQIVERGTGLSPEADRASRSVIGHAEGYFSAFANLYADIAEVIRARRAGRAPDPGALLYPTALDGLRSVATVAAAARSAGARGAWESAVPPSLRPGDGAKGPP